MLEGMLITVRVVVEPFGPCVFALSPCCKRHVRPILINVFETQIRGHVTY
jgi:hypothetical protein